MGAACNSMEEPPFGVVAGSTPVKRTSKVHVHADGCAAILLPPTKM